MTTTASDPNRRHREATARDEETDWAALATEPDGIVEERVDDPAGLWLRPRDALAGAAVLAVHGGGFISGSTATPVSMVLISAWVDLEATGGSYDTASDPFFTRELVRGLGAGYLAGADPRDPLAAALYADAHDLPPTYLQVGADEALLDDSKRLAEHLRDSGVDVRFDEFAGQLHTFRMAAGRTAVAGDAIERAGLWLRSTMSS